MGYPTMFYISDENRDKLKSVENRSDLINKLLEKHFEIALKPKMTKEQILIELEKNKIKREADEKIKELENAR